MATSIAAQPTVAANSKEKTKAKQRYLKRKKGRRKHRKSAAPHEHHLGGGQDGDEVGSAMDEDDGGSGEESDGIIDREVVKKKTRELEFGEDTTTAQMALDPQPGDNFKRLDSNKRPSKRRKIEHNDQTQVSDGDHSDASANQVEDMQADPSAPKDRRSITPQAALPLFPLPALPNAPSQKDLALQGLDQALVDAEIIDSTTVLPIPSAGEDAGTGLSERTRKRLHDLGITELFAVQTALLPYLLASDPSQRSLYLPYNPPRDVCVSAPTGSGKTLAYVLPIVEILSTRIVSRLRALVVLPTRDLVMQVRETFEAVGKGRGLKIGTATGHHSFAHEQAQLVADMSPRLQGGSSKVDILICTPGRLIDHLHGTPNFSLQHLRYLVIDEADRLLTQSFQDWLTEVLSAIRPSSQLPSRPTPSPSSNPALPYPDALALSFVHLLYGVPKIHTDFDEKKEPSCQKLLFSATLTKDPGKIAALDLRDPKYFVVQSRTGEESMAGVVGEKFTMPATLTEHMIVCESSQKPLMLFHLIHNHGITSALVFTKSAESTTRLVRLLEFLENAWFNALSKSDSSGSRKTVVHAYSSDLSPSERKSILDKFKAQEINILVASDLISRGVDISHVSHVVSYDVPVDMRKYVHRVGRTARAGRAGDAWTLVEEQEARYFKSMLKAADHLGNVKRMRISEKDVQSFMPYYETALAQLKDVYAR